ncbi:hypothetical protein PROVRUST_07865 [Providencia rustigianii DSM 4541]|uniref:Uncharacterized protein n=1 Tax=Providencia rustigianii DSM 4541 TaxID=500637 RepID=D1P6E3_9GAMM|nr:hypothetical protein PROVRUST_07865 [Providencia rustigianii DSM 4541]
MSYKKPELLFLRDFRLIKLILLFLIFRKKITVKKRSFNHFKLNFSSEHPITMRALIHILMK